MTTRKLPQPKVTRCAVPKKTPAVVKKLPAVLTKLPRAAPLQQKAAAVKKKPARTMVKKPVAAFQKKANLLKRPRMSITAKMLTGIE